MIVKELLEKMHGADSVSVTDTKKNISYYDYQLKGAPATLLNSEILNFHIFSWHDEKSVEIYV